MKHLKFSAALCAALMILCTGCSDKNSSDSSVSDNKKNTVSSSISSESKADTETDSKDSEDKDDDAQDSSVLGAGILQAYDFFKSSRYSMNVRYTDSEGNVTEIYRVVNDGDFYQLQKNKIGESGSVKVGDECYDFDKVCGIYRKSSAESLDSVIETVVDQKLPRTNTHIDPADTVNYDVEEYTYTGDTYITVMDFCFDKNNGELVKYTTTYSVEGMDDVTETREFYNLIPSAPEKADSSTADSSVLDESSQLDTDSSSYADTDSSSEAYSDSSSVAEPYTAIKDTVSEGSDIDESVFSTAVIDNLADFDNMTEERRLGYCQAIFVTAGINADDLAKAEYTDDKLKTISYDDFVTLVYTYGYKS